MTLNDFNLNIHFSQRMVMGLCASIATLVLITLTYSLWQWHKDWVLTHQNPPQVTTMIKNDMALIASIPENHIFGKSIHQMPITNLQMRVTGIVKVSGLSGNTSKAYISIEGRPSKIYKVGDDLSNGVTLHSISHDAVILENDGQFEKLPLPRDKLEFKHRSLKEHVE